MKKTALFICGLLAGTILVAQEVISSGGETQKTSGYEISWTLGEPVIETVTGRNNILTQGFHQTKLVVTPVLTFTENNQIIVYPNPTKEYVKISLKGMQISNITAEIYSMDGKLLKQSRLKNENSILEIQEFANGSYLLNISEGTELLQTFKIIKHF